MFVLNRLNNDVLGDALSGVSVDILRNGTAHVKGKDWEHGNVLSLKCW